MPNVVLRKEVFGAVVVGSGTTGGWATKELTEGGLRVALLEAAGSKHVHAVKQMDPFGRAIHEVGIARMGNCEQPSIEAKP